MYEHVIEYVARIIYNIMSYAICVSILLAPHPEYAYL